MTGMPDLRASCFILKHLVILSKNGHQPCVDARTKLSPVMKLARLSLLSIALATSALAQTSENNDKLREGLKRFPEADTNKDGILTMVEAQAFLAKMGDKSKGKKPTNPNATKPDFADVAYGPHERNVLDFWKAKSDKPTPLVVFIHGGGFRAGGKENYHGDKKLEELIKSGVSCASINYRFLPTAPIQDILRDCARAVQFLRSKSGEWNIDKTRVAAVGGSAGAGTSLWLDSHDDLADPKATDPVLRESSRVCCAGLMATQATYDVLRWPEFLGEPKPGFFIEDEVPLFYGLKSMDEVKGPSGEKARHECDMLAWLSKDDAPLFIDNNQDVPAPTNRGEWLHCTQHARTVKKQCQTVGIECVVVQDEKDTKPQLVDFLRKHLAVEGQ
jgi:hypothetical protein